MAPFLAMAQPMKSNKILIVKRFLIKLALLIKQLMIDQTRQYYFVETSQ
jgi:hypothetical protein